MERRYLEVNMYFSVNRTGQLQFAIFANVSLDL
jgi:hypothetical protein